MTQCELDCRKTLKVCNEKAEVSGHGPQWACGDFGKPGHDYQACELCHGLFDAYMFANGLAGGYL
jgi:hypothetical protein